MKKPLTLSHALGTVAPIQRTYITLCKREAYKMLEQNAQEIRLPGRPPNIQMGQKMYIHTSMYKISA
jgi:hypothetical protein